MSASCFTSVWATLRYLQKLFDYYYKDICKTLAEHAELFILKDIILPFKELRRSSLCDEEKLQRFFFFFKQRNNLPTFSASRFAAALVTSLPHQTIVVIHLISISSLPHGTVLRLSTNKTLL